jgi:hypothetical protein
MTTTTCPWCDQEIQFNASGRVRAHRDGKYRCSGSGVTDRELTARFRKVNKQAHFLMTQIRKASQ